MLPQWIIEKKRDGAELSTAEIYDFINGYTSGTIPDYQMSALAMAIYFRGMSPDETAALTRAMMESGKVIDPASIPGSKVDKHSTGGIGDKISIPLAPLVAACGATVPMISGRGLGITGGTLDKLESIPGYRTGLTEPQFFETLKACRCSMIGQTAEIAPADRKLYALRDVTATVPSIPLIVSSIMSKKLAEGIDALVLDVKCGSGAFMQSIDDARQLAHGLVETGRAMGKKVEALITDMNQPLGRNVGNSLEMLESIEILSNSGPEDVRRLTLELAIRMLALAGIGTNDGDRQHQLESRLADGTALETFHRMVDHHGGDLDASFPRAEQQIPFPATRAGFVTAVDAGRIGRAALLLGAGRTKTSDPVDHAVGFSDLKKVGETVEAGAPLCMIHSNGKESESELRQLLSSAFRISENQPEARDLILERIN